MTRPRHGSFVWNELNSWNPDEAKAFYGATLGWTFEAMPMDGGITYWVAKSPNGSGEEEMVGGIFPLTKPDFEGVPTHWFAYIEVDDVDARVAKVESAGGTVIRPPFDIPGIGRIAIVQDSSSAIVGWITSAVPPS